MRCEADILRVIRAQDGDTAIYGCVSCGWEERVPVQYVDGQAVVTTALACRRYPPELSVGLADDFDSDRFPIRVEVTSTKIKR